MTTYSIKIDYTTGNSLHSERTIEEVGMNWQNIDQAKKALQYIKKHYEACKSSEVIRWRDDPEFDITDI